LPGIGDKSLEFPQAKATTAEIQIVLPNCTFSFVKGFREIMSALTFSRRAIVAKVADAARAKGHTVAGDNFFPRWCHFPACDVNVDTAPARGRSKQ